MKPTRDELIEHVETLVAKCAALSAERDGLRAALIESDVAKAMARFHARKAEIDNRQHAKYLTAGLERSLAVQDGSEVSITREDMVNLIAAVRTIEAERDAAVEALRHVKRDHGNAVCDAGGVCEPHNGD